MVVVPSLVKASTDLPIRSTWPLATCGGSGSHGMTVEIEQRQLEIPYRMRRPALSTTQVRESAPYGFELSAEMSAQRPPTECTVKSLHVSPAWTLIAWWRTSPRGISQAARSVSIAVERFATSFSERDGA